jgi:hypothetical protein
VIFPRNIFHVEVLVLVESIHVSRQIYGSFTNAFSYWNPYWQWRVDLSVSPPVKFCGGRRCMMRRRAAAAAVTEAAHHIKTMTNSTAMEIAEMECGTSLAEDVWAIVPSSTTAMPSLSPLRVTNSESAGKAAAVSTASVTVEEAWTKIHQLRSRLAADVISDPPSSSSLSSTGFNFPTFISPFERPKVNNDKSTNGSSGTTTTITPTPNGSYQGMAIPLIYCDQTASQRPVRSIEDYIRSISMPCYANTHTVRRR